MPLQLWQIQHITTFTVVDFLQAPHWFAAPGFVSISPACSRRSCLGGSCGRVVCDGGDVGVSALVGGFLGHRFKNT